MKLNLLIVPDCVQTAYDWRGRKFYLCTCFYIRKRQRFFAPSFFKRVDIKGDIKVINKISTKYKMFVSKKTIPLLNKMERFSYISDYMRFREEEIENRNRKQK